MKKKTLLDEAGLKALLGKTEVSAEASDMPDKQLESEAAEAEEKDLEAVVPDKQDKQEDVDDLTTLAADFEAYKLEAAAREEDLDRELTALKEAHAAELAAANEAVDELKDIVAGQVARMRVALSLAAVDMKDFDPKAVATEYHGTADKFMKALPVGSVIPDGKDNKTADAGPSRSEASAYKSLGF